MNDPAHALNLVVTNFSGGKRHTGRGAIDRGALQDMARLASDVRTCNGFVMAVQEMTTDDPGLPIRAAAFEEALDSKALSSFIPRVSTAWYPLEEKWGEKIQAGGAYNEGLCVVTGNAGLVLMSWSLAPPESAGPANVGSSTRVIDLPNFTFPGLERDGTQGPWLESSIVINEMPHSVHFRPAYYHGNRNSDPRVAQACLLGWHDGTENGKFNPVCVLVNVHLSTLTSELKDGGRGRTPNSDATFLRAMQLDLIARYVMEVRAEIHGLPVIVAGDFNAEPAWPEMVDFADRIGSAGLLTADVCWRCGTPQSERPVVQFYSRSGAGGWDLTMESPDYPAAPKLSTNAVCSNGECLEPRFTHKGHGQLLDNVFVVPGRNDSPWGVDIGVPSIDVRWAYSDHAAIIVPLRFYQLVNDSSEVELGNAEVRN